MGSGVEILSVPVSSSEKESRAPLDDVGGAGHLLGQRQQFQTGGRQDKTVRALVEKARGKRFLQALNAPSHGRLAQLQFPRRRRKRAQARYGAEDADIIPVHDGTHCTYSLFASIHLFKNE